MCAHKYKFLTSDGRVLGLCLILDEQQPQTGQVVGIFITILRVVLSKKGWIHAPRSTRHLNTHTHLTVDVLVWALVQSNKVRMGNPYSYLYNLKLKRIVQITT